MEGSLESLNKRLKEVMGPDWFTISLANPMESRQQVIDFPNNNLLKENALALEGKI